MDIADFLYHVADRMQCFSHYVCTVVILFLRHEPRCNDDFDSARGSGRITLWDGCPEMISDIQDGTCAVLQYRSQ